MRGGHWPPSDHPLALCDIGGTTGEMCLSDNNNNNSITGVWPWHAIKGAQEVMDFDSLFVRILSILLGPTRAQDKQMFMFRVKFVLGS